MPIINPPAFMQSGTYNARVLRMAFNDIVDGSGVAGAGELVASPGIGLSVNLTPGRAYIIGEKISFQGLYQVVTDEISNIPVVPNSGTAPRKDVLYVGVLDSSVAGSQNKGVINFQVGTEGSSTLPVIPLDATPIAIVTVPVGAVSISAANIQDYRTYVKLNQFMVRQDFATPAEDWRTLPLNTAAGWTAYGGSYSKPMYRRHYDKIELQGLIRYSGPTVNHPGTSVIATLPVGYRPTKWMFMGAMVAISWLSSSADAGHSHTVILGNAQNRVDALPDGQLRLNVGGDYVGNFPTGNWLSLDGCSFIMTD